MSAFPAMTKRNNKLFHGDYSRDAFLNCAEAGNQINFERWSFPGIPFCLIYLKILVLREASGDWIQDNLITPLPSSKPSKVTTPKRNGKVVCHKLNSILMISLRDEINPIYVIGNKENRLWKMMSGFKKRLKMCFKLFDWYSGWVCLWDGVLK